MPTRDNFQRHLCLLYMYHMRIEIHETALYFVFSEQNAQQGVFVKLFRPEERTPQCKFTMGRLLNLASCLNIGRSTRNEFNFKVNY